MMASFEFKRTREGISADSAASSCTFQEKLFPVIRRSLHTKCGYCRAKCKGSFVALTTARRMAGSCTEFKIIRKDCSFWIFTGMKVIRLTSMNQFLIDWWMNCGQCGLAGWKGAPSDVLYYCNSKWYRTNTGIYKFVYM